MEKHTKRKLKRSITYTLDCLYTYNLHSGLLWLFKLTSTLEYTLAKFKEIEASNFSIYIQMKNVLQLLLRALSNHLYFWLIPWQNKINLLKFYPFCGKAQQVLKTL